MTTSTPRILPLLVCLALALTGALAPAPAHAVTKVITAYDGNESMRDGWDVEFARISKRDRTYFARVRWYDGYYDSYDRLVVVRFKAGKRRFAAQMEWNGSSWEGGIYRHNASSPVCTPFTRWGDDHHNVTMRFGARCVKKLVPRWVEGSSVVYTEVGNVVDHTPRKTG